MENDIVIPFVDDNYSGRKIGDNALFNRLNNYCRNIKLSIKLKQNPSKFLDTKITKKYKTTTTMDIQNAINKIKSMAIFSVQKKFYQTLTKKAL